MILKKDGCIRSIKEKVGKLASYTIINYWYCKHFEDWRIVDVATINHTKWYVESAQGLFATLQFSKNPEDKALRDKTMFKAKNKKEAIKIIEQILLKY